ncbi:hypothetical protein C0Q70_15739 [Pomacea canaliculata]|uniref:UspA domain-containing protein n=1 Tax=Pomacea canaliculata TaxID=400727 RepID=A0A2T7NVP0_POMCA|nr:uncharacterized protein LOC112572003 [Pomacea canaliculata]PVD25241.1 hypothetical protein C0Q70_15739 [Pomacea canaliculata]
MSGRKIFVAIDGSKPSDLAFNWCLDNIHREGDLIYLVHSAEYKVDIGLSAFAGNYENVTKEFKEEDERINTLIGNYIEACRKRQVQAVAKKLTGMKPGEAIISAAVEEGANMIIMGSRGLGKLRRTLMGSVSEFVVTHAPPRCAVTILRDS